MRSEGHDFRTGRGVRSRGAMAALAAAVLALSVWCLVPGAEAGTFYYTKDDGSVVMVDDLKKVPQRYRNRVKEFDDKPARSEGWSGGSIVSTLREKASGLMDMLQAFKVADRERYQSIVLAVGFVGAVFSFAVMVLSTNPGTKFAMKWVLMFVVVGMIYALYFSELKTYDTVGSDEAGNSSGQRGSLVQRMKAKAKHIEQNQQEHADELSQLHQR